MNLSLIDWSIVIVAFIALGFVAVGSAKHMKGVADFLSANRCAGRYLLSISGQMSGVAVIGMVACFEMFYQVGLPPIWWRFFGIVIPVIIILTGWIYWRFRETRALTLAQFFEMRYSRNFRMSAGFLCWLSGIINFGIFPAVAARFFIYFCGLPDYYHIPLPLIDHLPISMYATLMILNLVMASTFAVLGGQISVMITECFQGIICAFAFLIISGTVLYMLKWPTIIAALSVAPENASMVHPFHSSGAREFNIWYFIIQFIGAFYGYMSWQGNAGSNSAARSPHEQQMGGIIWIWREIPMSVMIVLLSLAAFTIMHLPQFANTTAIVNQNLGKINNEYIRTQMTVPIAIVHLLPVGVKGLLMLVMLYGSISCHATYMHSWGCILIQDVYMPFSKKQITPEQHVNLLRYSIIGVAVFAFLFSLLYPQTGKILMFQAITAAIWVGGAGAAIIGGLYWKRGTTAGAYCALLAGAVFGVGGMVIPPIYKYYYNTDFPINGQWLYLFSMLAAVFIYIFVSLITYDRSKPFNLDKMLNRGKYVRTDQPVAEAHENRFLKIIGINKNFTFTDKIWAVSLIVWNFGWFFLFIVVTAINIVHPLSNSWWASFWRIYVWMFFLIGIPTTIWFTIGGIKDIKALFNTLKTAIRDHSDDGSVSHEPQEPVVEANSNLAADRKE